MIHCSMCSGQKARHTSSAFRPSPSSSGMPRGAGLTSTPAADREHRVHHTGPLAPAEVLGLRLARRLHDRLVLIRGVCRLRWHLELLEFFKRARLLPCHGKTEKILRRAHACGCANVMCTKNSEHQGKGSAYRTLACGTAWGTRRRLPFPSPRPSSSCAVGAAPSCAARSPSPVHRAAAAEHLAMERLHLGLLRPPLWSDRFHPRREHLRPRGMR